MLRVQETSVHTVFLLAELHRLYALLMVVWDYRVATVVYRLTANATFSSDGHTTPANSAIGQAKILA